MKTRVQQIAEYLAETRPEAAREMFDGLNQRWPDVTEDEFEAAYAIYKVRGLDEIQQLLIGLGKQMSECEARGVVTDRAFYQESWDDYWKMHEDQTGQRRN